LSEPDEQSPSQSILRLDPFADESRVREIWQGLDAVLEQSFFLSWGWMAAWLATVSRTHNIQLISVLKEGTPTGAFFLGQRRGLRRGSLARQRAYLNATGYPDYDEVTIEYNGAVERKGTGALNCLFSSSQFSHIEEFNFSAVTQESLDSLVLPTDFSMVSCRELPSYFVDLAAIRRSETDYLEWLSRNKRSQLRRSIALYEEQGSVQTVQAESSAEALDMLSELRKLHELRWAKRDNPGAFSSEPFMRFHHRLIESRFDSGEIQLLKIANLGGTIGLLYNFVYNNEVLYYQSGFNYGDSNLLRPGLVCHHQAITHNLGLGRDCYNFLAGSSQFKKSLSTHRDNLYHIKVARNSWKLKAERFLRQLRDAARLGRSN